MVVLVRFVEFCVEIDRLCIMLSQEVQRLRSDVVLRPLVPSVDSVDRKDELCVNAKKTLAMLFDLRSKRHDVGGGRTRSKESPTNSSLHCHVPSSTRP